MMKILVFVFLAIVLPETLGQIGVKTRQPPASGNLLLNVTHEQHQPGKLPTYPLPGNGTAVFLNKTLTSIPTGICYDEVPTATLVKDSRYVPAGNGSDPSLSRIQVCCPGYQRNVHNFYRCDPICENECVNGVCVAPNKCECFPDHVRNLAGYCISLCPIGCGNGECKHDRTCECKPGYVLEPSRKFCIPLCSQGCLNGNCTAPDTCVCNKGYELSVEGRCEPKCDNCLNGRCTAPGVCECAPGYLIKDVGCEPVCTRECVNGFCSGPNQCRCNPGFALDSNGVNCIATCEPQCLNGLCVGANECRCFDGYEASYPPHMCQPRCAGGCPNGVCSSPNFCICNIGYVKDRSVKGREVCVPRT